MLLLAHTGITLGAATVLAGTAEIKKKSGKGILAWFSSLSEYADIRILIIGSMLPDLIDKPVGVFLFRDTFSNGRIFSHTLLFLVVLAGAGYYLYRRYNKTWLLVLAFGTFIHLLLDSIWTTPNTLFWPFLGFTFDRVNVENWVSFWFWDLFVYPNLFIPELVGLVILLSFAFTLIYRKKIGAFLKSGKS